MDSGMYTALAGNLTAMKRFDVISNNLANASTSGFKRDQVRFEALLTGSITNRDEAVMPRGDKVSGELVYTDFSPGAIRQTGNSLDLALKGDGFFVVNTPQGVAYTRQGRFQRNENGVLVTGEGFEVQGGGTVTIPGGLVDVDSRGRIFVDGKEIAALDIVDFPKPYALQKIGGSLFVPADPQQAPQQVGISPVQQGALEESNVSAVKEMAALIENSRFFEACEKVVRSYDEMKGKAVNELGKL